MSNARPVTLVTGGARRVGRSIVRAFAARGDALVVHYGQSRDDAKALEAELVAAGTPAHFISADLADPDASHRIVDAAMHAFGRLDVVISSASIFRRRAFADVTIDDWNAVNRVNLQAPFFLSQAAAAVMSEGGSIVHLCDHLAFEAVFPNLIPHQVSKAGVAQLVRVLAAALAPRIRVNAIAPGLVLPPDDMTQEAITQFLADVPLARRGTPDDVAQAVRFLVEAPYVTGVVLPVDGGRHLWR